jgi:hypothetical protein
MPEISRFFGIIISMFVRDHAPPHFHAKYGEFQIYVDIMTGAMDGEFPRKGKVLLLEWLEMHRAELLEDWDLAQQRKALNKIEPLDK